MDSSVQIESASFGIESIIITLIFLALCFFTVKSLISKLEPVDDVVKAEDEFLYKTSYDSDPIVGQYKFKEVNISSKGVNNIRYLPIVMVVVMFLLINWLYLFL